VEDAKECSVMIEVDDPDDWRLEGGSVDGVMKESSRAPVPEACEVSWGRIRWRAPTRGRDRRISRVAGSPTSLVSGADSSSVSDGVGSPLTLGDMSEESASPMSTSESSSLRNPARDESKPEGWCRGDRGTRC
jgi:hypothetical protein